MDFQYIPQDYGHFQASDYGGVSTVNKQYFNRDSGTDWKDSTAFAYQQQAKREDDALQIALMNYQNRYNSPIEQMRRYQEAGINFMDALGKATPAASAQAASGGSAGAHGSQAQAQKIQSVSNLIGELVGVVRGALGIQEGVQQMRYNAEVFPNMIAASRFLPEQKQLQLDQQLINVLASSWLYNVPMAYYGGNPDAWQQTMQAIGASPYGVGVSRLNNLRYQEYLSKKAGVELTNARKVLTDQQREQVEANTAYIRAQENLRNQQWSMNRMTGIEWLDRIIFGLLHGIGK